MSGDYLFLMEMILTLGFVVGIGVLELYLLHRSRKRDDEKARNERAEKNGD